MVKLRRFGILVTTVTLTVTLIVFVPTLIGRLLASDTEDFSEAIACHSEFANEISCSVLFFNYSVFIEPISTFLYRVDFLHTLRALQSHAMENGLAA
jgi:hypothetical protein